MDPEKFVAYLHCKGLSMDEALAFQARSHKEGEGSCNAQLEPTIQELHR